MPRFPHRWFLRWRIEPVTVLSTVVFTVGILFIFWCISKVEEVKDETYYQFVPDCACWKPFMFPPLPNRTRLKSSCSDEAAHYDPYQRVVSFTYFDTPTDPPDSFKMYKQGLTENLKRVQTFYPNFTMRVYTNKTLFTRTSYSHEFCKLLCTNKELHWCDIRKSPTHGDLSKLKPIMWRYLPLGDLTVELFLARDLTALVSNREASTVRDWLNISSKFRRGIHVIRDHTSQKRLPINGGLWGANNLILGRVTAQNIQDELISHDAPELNKGNLIAAHQTTKSLNYHPDAVTRFVYKRRQKDIIAYDSVLCHNWGYGVMTRGFPVQRLTNMTDIVGMRVLQGENLYPEQCSRQCRPRHGRSWEFC